MATISGTVKDSGGNFVARMVRAYRRSDGEFAGEGVSDATTGEYIVAALDTSKHVVFAVDGNAIAGDKYWDMVVLACTFDGENGATTFTDAKAHALTANGNAHLATGDQKFGSACGSFDGAGDFLVFSDSSDFDLSLGPSTIEMFFKASSLVGYETLICKATYGFNLHWLLQVKSDAIRMVTNNGNTSFVSTPVSITTGTWHHLAFVCTGYSVKFFIDGLSAGTSLGAITNGASSISIACANHNNPSEYFAGQIDDLRITKGVARYSANFSPPTAAMYTSLPSIGSPTENGQIFDNVTPT